MLGKVQDILEKDSPRSIVLLWYECIHGIGAQVILNLVHMHEGLVRFKAVARLVESGPSHVELQGGSMIAVAAVSKDRLNDKLLLVVLSDSKRIGADRIVYARAKAMDVWAKAFTNHLNHLNHHHYLNHLNHYLNHY